MSALVSRTGLSRAFGHGSLRRRGLHELWCLHRRSARSGSTCCRAGSSAMCCSASTIGSSTSRDAIFSCLLCRACEVSCPAGVHITENVRRAPPLARSRRGADAAAQSATWWGSWRTTSACGDRCCPYRSPGATAWARDLGIPRGGETVLYTGQMYQLIPYIERLVASRAAARRLRHWLVSAAWPAGRTGLSTASPWWRGRRAGAVRVRPCPRQRGAPPPAGRGRLRPPVRGRPLQRGADPRPGCRRGAVAAHARRVAGILRKHGVREVITIDPHTTKMLRTVYPTLVDGYDVRVRSYLEVLAERRLPVPSPLSGNRRHPRLLRLRPLRGGRRRAAPAARGRGSDRGASRRARGTCTWCCGGPAESLFPATAPGGRHPARGAAAGRGP